MSHPGEVYEKVPLGDGSFAKFERPLTFKVPEKIQYVEHSDKPMYMPLEGEIFKDTSWFEEYQESTINKLLNYEPILAYKHCKDTLSGDVNSLEWNVARLKQLDFLQLTNVYNLVNNANELAVHSPHLL